MYENLRGFTIWIFFTPYREKISITKPYNIPADVL